jgi:glutathione S-transferase
MPKFRLISFELCPYVQRAAIVLAEKRVPFERINIDLANKPDWFLKLSPLGKVPVLVVEQDGRENGAALSSGQRDGGPVVLFESAVIAEYLDETIGTRLHPADPLERAQHRAWIEFASATLADLYGLYAGDEPAHRDKLDALATKFARLEATLGDGPFFGDSAFSLADAAFAPVFRYFDAFERAVDFGLFDGKPKLVAWRRALAQRPSVIGAVSPDYPEKLLDFIRNRDGHMARLIAPARQAA